MARSHREWCKKVRDIPSWLLIKPMMIFVIVLRIWKHGRKPRERLTQFLSIQTDYLPHLLVGMRLDLMKECKLLVHPGPTDGIR